MDKKVVLVTALCIGLIAFFSFAIVSIDLSDSNNDDDIIKRRAQKEIIDNLPSSTATERQKAYYIPIEEIKDPNATIYTRDSNNNFIKNEVTN